MVKFKEPYLVAGSKGMLGTDLVRLLQGRGTPTVALDVDEMDIRIADSVMSAFAKYEPGVVINVAAYTDVDGCESRPEEAFSINAQGPKNLAKASQDAGSFLMHLSTDYVFDGTKRAPYVEEDPINPLGVYGRSKAEGESFIRELLPERHCIVRTQWLFGLHGKNFVEAILSQAQQKDVLRVVSDQRGTPTYVPDLAAALIKLCDLASRGTLHVTNSGEATWHEFAGKILELAGLESVRVEPMTTEELGRPAPRPAYSVMDNSRFIGLTGLGLRNWEDALEAYLGERQRAGLLL
ncbi:MAG: dTDP-4-dehydrorhamnose reductase [Desulfomonilaceae bacterium]